MAVFCLATYGEGDPTDNAQAFFDWLQEGGIEFNGKKEMVFCYQNCSDLIVLLIEKNLRSLE